MGGFAERLRAAMLAAGVMSVGELARKSGLGARRIMRILACDAPPPFLLAAELLALCDALQVRSHWLYSGSGPMEPIARGTEAAQALLVAGAMSRREFARWITMGKELSRG